MNPAKLRQWFPDLSPTAVEQFLIYHEELMRYNKAINLISPTTIMKADVTHFGDSILASQIIGKNLVGQDPVFDLGSGNGFPGVVFAILHPTRKVVLVERDQRKCQFLKSLVAALKASNIAVEGRSVEDLPPGSIKNAVARGFAPLNKALLFARKQVASGGRFFHLKSDGWATELAAVPSQIFTFWSPSLLGQYKLPDSNTEMFVVMTEKLQE